MLSNAATGLEEPVDALLVNSPPPIRLKDAERVARACYPGYAQCAPLSGERDMNFRISRADGESLTLKFINGAESLDETRMQIAVLKHLEARSHGMGSVRAPHHQPADAARLTEDYPDIRPGCGDGSASQDWLDFHVPDVADPVRVRAYGYLPGRAGTAMSAAPQSWYAVGRAAGQLDGQLADFEHPAAHRLFLWDACQVARVRPMLGAVESADERARIAAYLDVFELDVMPALAALPSQIIHNDLSPSNILVDAAGSELAGILDFGDMVHAPRIAEIAIAASYQMTAAGNPLDVLSAVVAGYESVSALTPQERRHVLDLVLARLVQRMAIPSWRALRFPGNGAYILRSRAAATALFNELYDEWSRGAR
ncbi:phosphotransferase [Achromobacter marplatensis]|uniref:Hydroxylysine kinase n=1 Tax=Achromobacter marplatensis TaxID=470868 RepID=A0AA42WBV1_9BURK|nr:phosphotransferase [Achromobacter marplatensis]EJO33296.1 aminotransferase [Achromobacter marplatensis]MDH2050784.1 phosphotransferase [Achromobacter marplatensis]